MADETEATQQGVLKRQASAAARQRLREAHPDEYRQYLTEEYTERGIEIPEDAEVKAAKKVAEILERHPSIQDKLIAALAPKRVGKAVPAHAGPSEDVDLPDPGGDFDDPEIPEGANPWGS